MPDKSFRMNSPDPEEKIYRELKEKMSLVVCINPECRSMNNLDAAKSMYSLSYRNNETNFMIKEESICCDLFAGILKKLSENIHKKYNRES